MKKKSTLIFVLLLIITCSASTIMTCIIKNGTVNDEDKMIISFIGDRSGEIQSRKYSFSRTYILKDGTIINGSTGNAEGKIKIN